MNTMERYVQKQKAIRKKHIFFWFFLGMAVWQVLCNSENPFPGVQTLELQGEIKHARLRPEIPAHTPDVLRPLMNRCWEYNPLHRPEMNDIVQTLLDDSVNNLNNYLFSPHFFRILRSFFFFSK